MTPRNILIIAACIAPIAFSVGIIIGALLIAAHFIAKLW